MELSASARLQVDNRLAYITLCRPEKKNALSPEMIRTLTSLFRQAESLEHVRVVILHAQGDVFSAGADIQYLQQLQHYSYEENLADTLVLKDLLLAIHTNRKIVIAQVEGHAIAGGCGLVTACDFAFAVPQAQFGYTEVRIGFVPALVSVFLLRKVHGAIAQELLLTGKLITAQQALDYGLINAIQPADRIADEVRAFAQRLCEQTSGNSLMETKLLLHNLPGMNLEAALHLAATTNARVRGSNDFQKGISAFLEKKPISW